IYMVGVSGGGWTTTVAAAIDPRILISVDVAGSLPLYLRPRGGPCVKPGDAGDMEQYHPAFYAIADYLDLYVLGSAGRGRGHLQVLNQFAPWCFAGVGSRTYEPILTEIIRGAGGRYALYLDSSHAFHQISQDALEKAVWPFFKRRQL